MIYDNLEVVTASFFWRQKNTYRYTYPTSRYFFFLMLVYISDIEILAGEAGRVRGVLICAGSPYIYTGISMLDIYTILAGEADVI
jgi:hypothetical protein